MWSTITKDFSEFTQNLKSESLNIIGLLSQTANEVLGDGPLYAGDECLYTENIFDATRINQTALRALQSNDATYLTPIPVTEQAAYEDWQGSSPLSSYYVTQHDKEGSVHTAQKESEQEEKADTTTQPTVEGEEHAQHEPSLHEKLDIARQRLLDYNSVVLSKYNAFVGDYVSPRTSQSPVRTAPPTVAVKSGEVKATATAEGQSATNDVTPPRPTQPVEKKITAATKYDVHSQSPTPASPTPTTTNKDEQEQDDEHTPSRSAPRQSLPSSLPFQPRLSEDTFFDRYFFRLHQLRRSEAAQRRNVDAAEEEPVVVAVDEAAAAVKRRETSHTGSDDEDETTSEASEQKGSDGKAKQNEADEKTDTRRATHSKQKEKPSSASSFAVRMLHAASELVSNFDEVMDLGSERDYNPKAHNDEGEKKNKDSSSSKALKSEDATKKETTNESEREAERTKMITELEYLVQELQHELRKERLRVAQLTTCLEEHNIPLPAPPQSTPSPARVPRETSGNEKEEEEKENEAIVATTHVDPVTQPAVREVQSKESNVTNTTVTAAAVPLLPTRQVRTGSSTEWETLSNGA